MLCVAWQYSSSNSYMSPSTAGPLPVGVNPNSVSNKQTGSLMRYCKPEPTESSHDTLTWTSIDEIAMSSSDDADLLQNYPPSPTQPVAYRPPSDICNQQIQGVGINARSPDDASHRSLWSDCGSCMATFEMSWHGSPLHFLDIAYPYWHHNLPFPTDTVDRIGISEPYLPTISNGPELKNAIQANKLRLEELENKTS